MAPEKRQCRPTRWKISVLGIEPEIVCYPVTVTRGQMLRLIEGRRLRVDRGHSHYSVQNGDQNRNQPKDSVAAVSDRRVSALRERRCTFREFHRAVKTAGRVQIHLAI